MHIKQHLTEQQVRRGMIAMHKEFSHKRELLSYDFVKDFQTADFKGFCTKELDGRGLLLVAQYRQQEDKVVGTLTPYEEVVTMLLPKWTPPETRLGAMGHVILDQHRQNQAAQAATPEKAPMTEKKNKGGRKPGMRLLNREEKLEVIAKVDRLMSEGGYGFGEACKVAGSTDVTIRRWKKELGVEQPEGDVVGSPKAKTAVGKARALTELSRLVEDAEMTAEENRRIKVHLKRFHNSLGTMHRELGEFIASLDKEAANG
jgi:hypothetical protein